MLSTAAAYRYDMKNRVKPVRLSVAPTSQVGTGTILETEKANINHSNFY